MHPFFKSGHSLLAFLIFWLIICILIGFLINNIAELTLAEITFSEVFRFIIPWFIILLFFCFSNFYVCERLPLQALHPLNIFSVQIIALVISILLWALCGLWYSHHLSEYGHPLIGVLFNKTLSTNITIASLLYIVWVFMHYVYLSASANEKESAELLQQKLLISDIELQTIKATIHPHFMYNTLTMLANLSLITPEKIHDLCVKMADFLRYSVNYSKKDRVSVGDELMHIKNYLAIEQERFSDRLNVSFTVDDSAKECPVVPLILFPLIENSVKHGIGSMTEGGFIAVSILKQDNRLNICVKNSFDKNGGKRKSTGIGLPTLRKRLAGCYGLDASMSAKKSDDLFTVNISLPCQIDQTSEVRNS